MRISPISSRVTFTNAQPLKKEETKEQQKPMEIVELKPELKIDEGQKRLQEERRRKEEEFQRLLAKPQKFQKPEGKVNGK